MGFFDDLADGINELFFEKKIDDPVRGSGQVISVTAYHGHGLYQNCHLQLVVQAAGVPATAATVDALVHRDRWPRSGQNLPVHIDRSDPTEVEVLWDEVPLTPAIAKAHAEALAAARRAEDVAGDEPTPLGGGTTVRVVGDVDQITDEQREKLRAIGIDIDALLGNAQPPR
jgi:hypothetical protein